MGWGLGERSIAFCVFCGPPLARWVPSLGVMGDVGTGGGKAAQPLRMGKLVVLAPSTQCQARS